MQEVAGAVPADSTMAKVESKDHKKLRVFVYVPNQATPRSFEVSECDVEGHTLRLSTADFDVVTTCPFFIETPKHRP